MLRMKKKFLPTFYGNPRKYTTNNELTKEFLQNFQRDLKNNATDERN